LTLDLWNTKLVYLQTTLRSV